MIFFVSEFRSRRAIAPRGRPAVIVHSGSLPKAGSITLITSLCGYHHFTYNTRYNSNTQADFKTFIEDLVIDRRLVVGDILVLDNATVHVGDTLYPDEELDEHLLTIRSNAFQKEKKSSIGAMCKADADQHQLK